MNDGMKFTFHLGHARADGIGDFWRAQYAAGQKVTGVSVNHVGRVYEMLEIAGFEEERVFPALRFDRPGGLDDVPDYGLHPEIAAVRYGTRLLEHAAQHAAELDDWRHLVYLVMGNEWRTKVDEDNPNYEGMHPMDWWGEFHQTAVEIVLSEGWKVLSAAFNAGEPEPEDWARESVATFMLRARASNGKIGLAFHEGFGPLDANNVHLREAVPHLTGRFLYPLTMYGNVPVAITEWAFSYNSIPSESLTVEALEWTSAHVYNHEAVELAALWTLHSRDERWGDLPATLNSRLPVIQTMVGQRYGSWTGEGYWPPEDLPDTPGTDDESFYEQLWRESVERQPISLNPQAALQATIFSDGFTPVQSEFRSHYEGASYAVQAAEHVGTGARRVYWARVPEWNNVRWFGEPGGSGDAMNLSVPYLSQWGANAGASRGDCGPACVAMIAGYYGITVTVDQAAVACGQPPGSANASIGQLRQGLGHYGVPNAFAHPLSLPGLRQELIDGHPVILLVHYGDIEGRQDVNFTGGHFFLAVGFGEDTEGPYFLVNDPNFWGDRMQEGNHRRVAAGVLEAAMANATRDGNYPRQAIIALGVESPAPPPPSPTIDVLPYLRGDGRLYEVRHEEGANAGSQERFQTQDAGNSFFLVKNSQWEEFVADDEFIWRGRDTSPGPAPDYAERPGAARWYRQFEEGDGFARWCRRHMRVGETYEGPGHRVQFYYKSDCAPSVANSGPSTNVVALAAHHERRTWNGITLEDVVELFTSTGERMWFARGYGLVAWESRWGRSAISEWHAPGSRPDNVMETGCFF